MKTAALLLCGFLLAYQNQLVLGQQGDWFGNLFSNLNHMNQEIQAKVQQTTQQIQQNVNQQVALANQQVADALKNIDKLNGTHTQIGGDGSVIITNNSGVSHQVHSGTGPDGKPYYREQEETVVGDTLFHTERVYNPDTKKLEEHRWTLNLTDPNAQRVPVEVTSGTSSQTP